MRAIEGVPTNGHLIIAELMRLNIFKYLITQNVDNLHRKSGVSRDRVIELHGNIQVERCVKCFSEFYRDYYCRPPDQPSADHYNGRNCPKCKSQLHDSLVFFGERLHEPIKSRALEVANESDFCLVVGSSLKVNPA